MPIEQDQKFGHVPLQFIRESETNPRKHFNEAKLQELADSIKVSGVGQPILVRPLPDSSPELNLLEIVAGARRFRASKLAGKDTIPALVCDMTDIEARKFQLVENLQREDVHPMEEAEGYRALIDDQGLTVEEVIKEMGKSRAYIYARLKLCALTPDVRTAFLEEKLTASTALLIARIPVPALQEQATKEILAGPHGQGGPMSVRQAEAHIQSRYTLELEEAEFDTSDAQLLPSAGGCHTCPKMARNQPELYPNLKNADVCTDPDCFEVKNKTHMANVITFAKKKKLPIIESYQELYEPEYNHLVRPYARLADFQRIPDDTPEKHRSPAQAIPKEHLPAPAAYFNKGESISPIYDKTAIQEALEKAGLALTVEKHAELIAEKLAAGGGATDPALEKPIELEPDPDEIAAERECKYREALYKKIRSSAPSIKDIIRPMAKMLLASSVLPSIDGLEYDFDSYDDEEIAEFINTAPIARVQDLVMDLLIGDTLEVNRWT